MGNGTEAEPLQRWLGALKWAGRTDGQGLEKPIPYYINDWKEEHSFYMDMRALWSANRGGGYWRPQSLHIIYHTLRLSRGSILI